MVNDQIIAVHIPLCSTVMALSQLPEEEELLSLAGQQWKVVRIHKNDGTHDCPRLKQYPCDAVIVEVKPHTSS